jgi:gliding motility associated protien GldN
MKKLVYLLFVLLTTQQLMAQGVYDDFIYTRQSVQERKVVPWPYLREADVHFAKRITRVIDVREKQNKPMAWPKNPLGLILYNAVRDGKLIPYSSDSLATAYEIDEFLALGTDTTYGEKSVDPDDPTITEPDTIVSRLRPEEDINKFLVVEDWIFDKKESRMYVRIIAIAPMYRPKVAGVEFNYRELCFLKYFRDPNDPDEFDVREILVNYEIFNPSGNDAKRITFDDWFEQRMFSSYITKESNMWDLRITDMDEFKTTAISALLEAERIKNSLFEFEHDLWEY